MLAHPPNQQTTKQHKYQNRYLIEKLSKLIIWNIALFCFVLFCLLLLKHFYSFIGDIHRNSYESSFKPKVDDIKTINSWGITSGPTAAQGYNSNANPFIKDSKNA